MCRHISGYNRQTGFESQKILMNTMQSHVSVPLICVIVPNKNGIAHLSYSLPSLFTSTYSNYQVILVDDRSTDTSTGFVEERYPFVRILLNNAKRGFAATVNVGVRYAIMQRAEYVAISNNDIKIPPWLLDRTVTLFPLDPSIGIVGFREITGDVGRNLFPTSPEKIGWSETKNITGCFFMIKTAVFSKIGFFDEDYFMYGEDNDFFYRTRKAGFKTIAADIPVWHYGEGTSGRRPFLSTWLGYRNSMRFAIKNLGPLEVLRMLGSLFYHGCVSLKDKSCSDLYLIRIRRYSPFTNFLLIIASCAWNLFYLPKTLLQRYHSPGGECHS